MEVVGVIVEVLEYVGSLWEEGCGCGKGKA